MHILDEVAVFLLMTEQHLELTMIHEVMILDNSGPDLALLIYGSYMKMFIIGSLIANLIIPYTIGLAYSIPLFILVQFILAIAIGCIESLLARFRMSTYQIFIHNEFYVLISYRTILIFNLWGRK
jgi:formate hydrogenlyase subunit 4